MKLSEVICKALVFLGIGVIVLSIAPRLLSRTNVAIEHNENVKWFEAQVEDNEGQVVELDHGDIQWQLFIPEIELDYFVYHNSEDNYYLHKDEDGKDSKYGELYFNNDNPDVIYGHNMADNTMFGRLDELYEGCMVIFKDMTHSDMKEYNYKVVDYKATPADGVWEYLGGIYYDKALVTCNPTHDKGRLVIVLKEV